MIDHIHLLSSIPYELPDLTSYVLVIASLD